MVVRMKTAIKGGCMTLALLRGVKEGRAEACMHHDKRAKSGSGLTQDLLASTASFIAYPMCESEISLILGRSHRLANL